jgi:DSF synthase
MHGAPRPSFTVKLLNDINQYLDNVKQEMADTGGEKFDYLEVGSDVEGVFNLGGDLDLFRNYIADKNRQGLLSYAMKCIDILYQNTHHNGLDLTTIPLIQGDALGGGFEAALPSNVIVAEKGSKMGFPEVLFNLFPGMGAYSLLSREIGSNASEKMILSGEIYTAEALYDMSIIDILADKGEGEMEIYRYIKSANRSKNTHRAMQKVKDICNPVSYQELVDVAVVWADAALELTDKDLKMIDRLVKRQNKRLESI